MAYTSANLNRKRVRALIQDINPGINTIIHNLNLSDSDGFIVEAFDMATKNGVNISNFQNTTSNSFDFNNAVFISQVHFTIIG